MASTSTSYNQQLRGFIRIENERPNETCDYPLYNSVSVSSSIDIANEDPVIENALYGLSVLFPTQYAISEISVSVNGSDPITTFTKQSSSETINGLDYYLYQASMSLSEKHLFLLTYGFARIEVILTPADIAQEQIMLTTKDIPCLSNENYQASLIAQMLDELLDADRETVTRWMFTGNESDNAAFSILDAAFRNDSPKSLSSIIQIFEAAVLEYEQDYNYFNAHGFSKIVHTTRKLPPRKLRRSGIHELLWMAKNSSVLTETPYETSIDYLGHYYLPRELETSVTIKSYNSYENQLILGFLDELLSSAKTIYASLKIDIESVHALEERLNPIRRNGYSLPALTLVRQCANRENYYLAKLQGVIDRFKKLKRKYKKALPGVRALFSRLPRRTKVFQEVKCYSSIYDLILRWLKFGDFTLARENLALHSLRLDKLYEYYVLFKLLCWFENAGFVEDDAEETPIESAVFSLKNKFFNNESQVATLYKLAHHDLRIRLYYQPVIYGDEREENGITLHRLSPRKITSSSKQDSYWTPDFMLKVIFENGESEWHIFDAKFSKAKSLWKGYPKEGIFTTMMSKYKTDICGMNQDDEVSSLWLLCGREPGQCLQFAEQSTWAIAHYENMHSGIGALTPAYSCLDEVIGSIVGVNKINQLKYGAESLVLPENESLAIFETSSRKNAHVLGLSSRATKSKFQSSFNRCLPLIVELFNNVEDNQLLYKSKWTERHLGIAHPLLRKAAPQGRERKYYEKAELSGVTCYVYSNWLPNYENKLRALIDKNQ